MTFPAQVTSFQAVAQNSNTIECTWRNPNAADFDSLLIFRNFSSYETNPIDNSSTLVYAGKSTRFPDTGLFPDTTYYYSLFSLGSTGFWQTPTQSARDSARTPKALGKPEPIVDLTASVLKEAK